MDVESMRQYLGAMWMFGRPATMIALVAILGIDLGLTYVHVAEEFKGRLWSYFGAIAGVRIPAFVGMPLFTVFLTVALWAVGFAGIGGSIPFLLAVPENWGAGMVGVLIGGRVSDGLFSHILLRKKYYPNPGMKSIPFYFAEAVVLIVVFFPGLWNHVLGAGLGFAIGFLFFYGILPVLRLFRTREPWEPGKSRPAWAR